MNRTWGLIKKLLNCRTSVSLRKSLYNYMNYFDGSDNTNLINSYFTYIRHSHSDKLETNSFDPIQYVSYITETISLNPVSSSECSKTLASLKVTAKIQIRWQLECLLTIKITLLKY